MTRRCVVDIFKRVKILILKQTAWKFFSRQKENYSQKNFWKNYWIVKFLETEKQLFSKKNNFMTKNFLFTTPNSVDEVFAIEV